jgi:hypothetical protein
VPTETNEWKEPWGVQRRGSGQNNRGCKHPATGRREGAAMLDSSEATHEAEAEWERRTDQVRRPESLERVRTGFLGEVGSAPAGSARRGRGRH